MQILNLKVAAITSQFPNIKNGKIVKMAFVENTLQMFTDVIDKILSKQNSCKIFEFGDQVLMQSPSITTKKYIQSIYGTKISQYISLDINGNNGCETGDMREDLSKYKYGTLT